MDREGSRRVSQVVMVNPTAITMDANPPGRVFWLEDHMLPVDRRGQVKPTFKVAEVARVFFARSADWLRWLGTRHDRDGGVLELDGKPLIINRTESGSRVYTLVDVERLAHALLQHGQIDAQQFVAAINIIRWIAFNYRILLETQVVSPTRVARLQGEQLVIEGIDQEIARMYDV